MNEGVTLCLTAGGRPDLLERTLRSLLALEPHFEAIIIANDWGDPETSMVARRLCPTATIIDHSWRQGQHASVDEMYALVKTPFIFHCEDDWEFAGAPFLDRCAEAMAGFPSATVVCVRDRDDFATRNEETKSFALGQAAQTSFEKMPNFASFSFNPSLLKTELWRSVGSYSRFNDERDIDHFLRERGGHAVYLVPGICVHIGEGRHQANPIKRRDGGLRDFARLVKYRAIQLGSRLKRRFSRNR